MRKQLKEASGFITRAQDILKRVSVDDRIPENVRTKSEKIHKALEIDLEELERMREYK